MAQPFVGEIRMFAGNFEPNGWRFCDGRLLPISENETLFGLLGTIYGGDGESTFALPDLRGRVPVHRGNGFVLGQAAGSEEVTLTVQQVPVHSHAFLVTTGAGETPNPQGSVLATSSAIDLFRESTASQPLAPAAVGVVGGSQPHTNFQPYLCLNFIISLFGLFPPPN